MSTRGTRSKPRKGKRKSATKRKAAKASRPAAAHSAVVNGVEIPKRWLDVLLLLPGYDPRDHATMLDVELDDDGNGRTRQLRCTFDADKADRAVRFIETHCVHVKGKRAGKPVKLEPWQRAVVGNLFGWVRPDGTRRYRFGLIYIPRKNGKTTLAACIVAYLLCSDGEQGAEIYSAAGARDQAATIYRMLDRMRALNPELAKRTQSYSNSSSITYPRTASTYRAVPSDAKTLHGGDSHGVVIDELHVLKSNPELVEVLTTSVGAREQPVVLYLTTADFAGSSVCNDKLEEAHDVMATAASAEGVPATVGAFLPCVWEATRDDDWTKPATWKKANPNLGVSLRVDYVATMVQAALRSPSTRNSFLRLQLNVQTDTDVAFVPMELWAACKGPDPYLALWDKLKGMECWAGLDLASRRDLASWCLYFPEPNAFLWRCYMPEQRARDLAAGVVKGRRRDDRWLLWGEQPLALTLHKGRSIQQQRIREDLVQASTLYSIRSVSFDRWGAHKLRGELEGDGLTMVEMGQGFRDMTEPTKELEQLWLDGVMRHGANPVVDQCARHLMVREDEAGNLKPNKQTSGGPIDPMVAAVMAVGGALTAEPPEDTSSVYDERGVRRLGG